MRVLQCAVCRRERVTPLHAHEARVACSTVLCTVYSRRTVMSSANRSKTSLTASASSLPATRAATFARTTVSEPSAGCAHARMHTCLEEAMGMGMGRMCMLCMCMLCMPFFLCNSITDAPCASSATVRARSRRAATRTARCAAAPRRIRQSRAPCRRRPG